MMQLVYKFNHYKNNEKLDILSKTCNDLYNQTLYLIKNHFEKTGEYLSAFEMDKIMKVTPNLDGEINYKLLKAQSSQQVLKILDKNFKSYFKSIKDWKKNPSKYKGMPKPPSFKKSGDRSIIYYTNQNCKIKGNLLILDKDLIINLPQNKEFKQFNQVRIIPKKNYYEIEIVYERMEASKIDSGNVASIDFGINNIVTMISNLERPIIINGKQIKDFNQLYNKQKSRLVSIKDKMKVKGYTKKLYEIETKRNNKMKDMMHKISAFIVNYCKVKNVGKLVVGYNKSWKTHINLGNKTNQTFTQIPFAKLLQMLNYKCKLIGCELVETEESYTSKCDHLADEEMKHHKEYRGKRIKRGLFRSSIGKVLNSDVNGALGIMKKVVDKSFVRKIINSGFLFNPVKIRNVFEINRFNLLTNSSNCVEIL